MFDIDDSEVEGILGADGDISEEESRILEMGFQQVIFEITCLVIVFHSAEVTSFE